MTKDEPEPSERADRGSGHRARRTRVLRTGGNSRLRISLVALGAGGCLAAAGVTLAAFSSAGPAPRVTAARSGPVAAPSGPTSKPRATPPPASTGKVARTATVAPAAAEPGAASDGIAKTALRWPPALESRIQRWDTGPGGAALRAVTAQLGNTMQAAGVKLYPEVKQACVALALSVQTALAAPPIPYAAMQQAYGEVLAGLSGAATECRNAISLRPEGDEDLAVNLNKVLLNHSRAVFAAESEALYEATAEIRTLRA